MSTDVCRGLPRTKSRVLTFIGLGYHPATVVVSAGDYVCIGGWRVHASVFALVGRLQGSLFFTCFAVSTYASGRLLPLYGVSRYRGRNAPLVETPASLSWRLASMAPPTLRLVV